MKAKKGFNLRSICGERVIVAEGKENIDFSNIISMNEASAYLWDSIGEKEFTVDMLADLPMPRLLYSNGERQASSRNRPISFRAPLVFASMRGCVNIFYDTSSFLYLFQCYHVERKKILIYRISDFHAEKRF